MNIEELIIVKEMNERYPTEKSPSILKHVNEELDSIKKRMLECEAKISKRIKEREGKYGEN